MYKLRMFNLKWQLLGYFLTVGLITVFTLYIAFEYYGAELSRPAFRFGLLAALLVVGLVMGYVATKRWQRKIDELHLAILELSKGNFTSRVDMEPVNSFHDLFDAFNKMAAAVQTKIQLLQKLGEAEAIQDQQLTEAAVMEERRRLARDLHDTVSQELFAIHMAASSLPKIIGKDAAAAASLMEHLIQMSHHAQKQMRGLISQLRPIELDNHSLEEALEKWFPAYCQANDLQGQMEVVISEEISEAIEHQLFLIIQEGMANVVKHASADQIRLSLQEGEHQYMLQLVDNGLGFERSEIPSASHGLSTMRERAQKLGGNAEIFSKLGSGTRIRVQIPKFTNVLPLGKQAGEEEGKDE
ncbi:HAMP domain-containing sensor histidine kinase [Paenibacillus eucommiae]|uniref:histidine kinase n=1 Tax=Paenibacillus eucommiae TaxID=1355755 RepID=A0ABS4J0Z4_9BACL|nr:HAMP domain-containing sensor histidine kinase [Paenibacillus eucommiae]MBP1993465.1 NarL family two-component system sensor histidine kinase LiaS [Paenibacillus eucommiae]